MKRGKKWLDARGKIDRLKEYSLEEAVSFLKENSFTKFDETMDIAVNLGIDPRKSDQTVRNALVLPHGIGKDVRVLAFAQGAKVQEALDAGADYVGSDEFAAKITSGWMEFDAVVATPDMMRVVGKLGKILGPRGMMPNPKVGTVTMDIAGAVKEMKAGKVEFRVEKGAILHAGIGRLSFDADKLRENVLAFMGAVLKAKPQAAKGTYIKRVTLSSTMGQGLKVRVLDFKS